MVAAQRIGGSPSPASSLAVIAGLGDSIPTVSPSTSSIDPTESAAAGTTEPASSADSSPTSSPSAVAADPTAVISDRAAWAANPTGYNVISDVAFTTPVDCGGGSLCQVGLDVYVPTGSGPFPTIVLIGPGGRGYLSYFAADLALQGYLVYNANFRDIGTSGGGYPAGFQDVACAIRFARADASQHSGVAQPLTLVGHSLGGWVGSVVALDPTEFQGNCLAGGSGRPDAFVGFSGNYWITSGENAWDLESFFGGTAAQTSTARAASDPFAYATGTSIPVRLLAGTDDESVDPAQSQQLYQFLAAKGWDVTLTMVPGASHMSVMDDPAAYSAIDSAFLAAM